MPDLGDRGGSSQCDSGRQSGAHIVKAWVMPKSNHVLLVSRPVCPPWDEGSKNSVRLLAQNMRNHVLHLMTTAGSTRSILDVPDKIVIEPLYSNTELTYWGRFQLMLRLIRNMPPVDTYHFYFTPTKATSYILRVITRKVGVRMVQTIASLPTSEVSDREIKHLIFSNTIVVMSRWTEQRLRSAGVSSVIRIPPPVDIQRFSPYAISNSKYRLKQEPTRKLVLYPGEYSRHSSIPILSNAIFHVCRDSSHVDFVVTSRINKKRRTRRLLISELAAKELFLRFLRENNLTDRVLLMEKVEDMPALINTCDLVVYPAKKMDGKFDIPMVLAECLAMGKPLIVSDIPLLSEIVEDDIGILTSADDDGSELAEMILSLLGDTARLSQMSETARKLAIARFDARIVARRYEDIYSQL